LMYAESCAAMGLVQLASRLFNLTGKTEYLEVLETAIYNGVLSGIGLNGNTFFYSNYLEVDENSSFYNFGAAERQPWFSCPCCPTSFSRFLPQLGSFVYSTAPGNLYVNMYPANQAELQVGDLPVKLEISGHYPYDGNIRITMQSAGEFTLHLRIPQWCKKSSIKLNGREVQRVISGNWQIGDVVEIVLDMPVEVMLSNQKITGNLGRIALKRGPLVYALEELDQICPVREIMIRRDQKFELKKIDGLPDGTLAISGKAYREILPADELYFNAAADYEKISFCAVPYALWGNRGKSNMCVWNRYYK